MSAENMSPDYRAEEMKEIVAYQEIATSIAKAERCVDGRAAGEETPEDEQGPQTLGGGIGAVFVRAIEQQTPLTSSFIADSMQKLADAGHKPGVHRDTHREGENCGCGFCDKLGIIHNKVVSERDLITKRLTDIYTQNGLDVQALHMAYDKIAAYPAEHIQIQGEAIIQAATDASLGDARAKIETVVGEHAEEVAFLNVKPNTTLNTKALNREGRQGFNLDLWAAVAQGEALGSEATFATHANIILYAATEMVLVEDKGKPALPVIINS